MKTLTWDEAAQWSRQAGMRAEIDRTLNEFVDEQGAKQSYVTIHTDLRLPNEDCARRLTLPLPSLPYQVAYLANALLPYDNSPELQPCLLWITDWGIWSDISERVADSIIGAFRSRLGEVRPIKETPAHLFMPSENADAQTLLTCAIVFGWDCYVIPKPATYYVKASHDEFIAVTSNTPETHQLMTTHLERWRVPHPRS